MREAARGTQSRSTDGWWFFAEAIVDEVGIKEERKRWSKGSPDKLSWKLSEGRSDSEGEQQVGMAERSTKGEETVRSKK